MSQKNASPTAAQADVLRKNHLDPLTWTVVKDFPSSMIVRDRITCEYRHIMK